MGWRIGHQSNWLARHVDGFPIALEKGIQDVIASSVVASCEAYGGQHTDCVWHCERSMVGV
jgi:hypothetical protein